VRHTIKRPGLLAAVVLVAATAFAQDSKFEVMGDYSYMQFNPTLNGLQSRAFNGGGGGIQWNLGKFFGIKGDFQGYASTKTTFTTTTPIVNPLLVVPAGTFTSTGNMFTYMFGPVVKVHASRFSFYGETLFGASNSNLYGNLARSIDAGGGSVTASESQHPFTMAFGGGVDLNLSKHFALRLGELDWVLTRYTNPITSTNNQHSFRYLGGVVFMLGGQ
jgi:Outer membrane protein beta-barrel domain